MGNAPFVLFGTIHLFSLALIFLIVIGLPYAANRSSNVKKDFITKAIAFLLLLHAVASPYQQLFILENPYHWKEVLPFHMCDFSEIILAWFLLGGPKILFNLAYFWGIAGATMALLTPDVLVGGDLDYILFFAGHGMIVIGVFYAILALGNLPTLKDTHQVILITIFILLPIIYGINVILGDFAPYGIDPGGVTNYWYLMAKPDGESLLDLFPPPPGHIVPSLMITVSIFYLIYLPIGIKNKLNNR
tara:strand:- start:3728 stop:4465 length:738 start_codon:yes stop_codon:yes gene_type:complete